MNSFITAFNEGSSDLISKIDLVNKGLVAMGGSKSNPCTFFIISQSPLRSYCSGSGSSVKRLRHRHLLHRNAQIKLGLSLMSVLHN